MRRIIILLMIVSPLMGQENQKSKKIWSPKVSIFSTIYGISDFKGSNLPPMSVGFDWMVGKKVYYYGKLQFDYRFGDFILSHDQFLSSETMQVQPFGVGSYLLDTRKQDLSTGWSMVMNFSFGMGVYFGIQDGYDEWADIHLKNMDKFFQIIGRLFYFPLDVSLYARYHINKASAVQFGINIAGNFGAYNQLLYGFTLGFAF